MIEDTDGWFGIAQKIGVLCCGSIDPTAPRRTLADFFLELMPNERRSLSISSGSKHSYSLR
jgi:hypothetical protein